jgi:hypothetical protein
MIKIIAFFSNLRPFWRKAQSFDAKVFHTAIYVANEHRIPECMARQSLSPGHRDRRIIAIIQASHGTGAIFFAVTMLCKLRIRRRQPA